MSQNYLTPLGRPPRQQQQQQATTPDPTAAQAARIVLAAARARGEIEMEAELQPTDERAMYAKATILSGMRRRAEPLAEADEIWLNRYLARLDRAQR